MIVWLVAHCKKRFGIFPSTDGMSLTKLPLAGNNLIFPARESLVSDIPAGNGKIDNFFGSVTSSAQARDAGIWWGTLGKLQLMLRKAAKVRVQQSPQKSNSQLKKATVSSDNQLSAQKATG
jgi:hypothetical protein